MLRAYETGVVTTLPATKLIITYSIYVGNWWSLKESNHPPTTLQLKATDLQSAEGNRLQKYNRIVFFAVGIEPTNVCLEGKLTSIVMRLIFAETILKLVPMDNFEMSAFRLSSECSSSELHRQMLLQSLLKVYQ